MITDYVGSYIFARNRNKGITQKVQQELSTGDWPQIIRQVQKWGKRLLTVGRCQRYRKKQSRERNPMGENQEE